MPTQCYYPTSLLMSLAECIPKPTTLGCFQNPFIYREFYFSRCFMESTVVSENLWWEEIQADDDEASLLRHLVYHLHRGWTPCRNLSRVHCAGTSFSDFYLDGTFTSFFRICPIFLSDAGINTMTKTNWERRFMSPTTFQSQSLVKGS